MFMPHDEGFAIYDGPLEDIHALDTWVSARRIPMVMRLTSETADKILEPGSKQIPSLFLISNGRETAIEQQLREAAKSLRGRAIILFSGISTQIERRMMDLMGAEEDSLPIVALLDLRHTSGSYKTAKKYKIPTEDILARKVVRFVNDFENGRLKPWLRSEPVPSEEEMVSGLGVLVGSTYSAKVHDTTKDVLVNFYAPWCGHCRKFEPVYKILAKRLQHVNSLKVFKIDATRNEVEGMLISGFPTIALFPAGGGKRQVEYHARRDPDEIMSWLHEHCSIKFDERVPRVEKPDDIESGLLDPSEDDL